MQRRLHLALAYAAVLFTAGPAASDLLADDIDKTFRAGAFAADITPAKFPVVVNGMFNSRTGTKAYDTLRSRALVLDDGTTRLAIVVVDNLMMPRELIDEAKRLALAATGIPTERMLVSATHTHSAPSVMGCLGSGVDPEYPPLLVRQIARSIEQANKNVAPARIGWTVVEDHEHTHCRRWIRHPDHIGTDPFGVRNVRAHMHPGYQSPHSIGPAGPDDPDLSILSVQSPDGRPIAVLANYATHYYGSPLISGDFCGRFGAALAKRIGAENVAPAFVGIMSQGTSGDIMWMDYGGPRQDPGLDGYTDAVAEVAAAAYETIEYRDFVSLAMAETKLPLRRRVPDEKRLAWAQQIVAKLDGREPSGMAEIYAREQVLIHEEPVRELVLQAIRIGELGITAIPDEVYAITGLKLKAQSPLVPTFNIELANGAEGYIPPPEQHRLGGYTTWPARTAGLEVEAEPKIVAALLELLEKVAGKPRRPVESSPGRYAQAVLGSKPLAYWRMDAIEGSILQDVAGENHAALESGAALYLPGPEGKGFSTGEVNRAVHFAGGRMKANLPKLGDTYSVELWFWNGLPNDARPVTGYLFSRGRPSDDDATTDRLGIGGTGGGAGKLFFTAAGQQDQPLFGGTPIEPKTWNYLVLVRSGDEITVFLNGKAEPEIHGSARPSPTGPALVTIAACAGETAPFEGKIDEVAIYDRVLTASEIQQRPGFAGFGTGR